LSIVLFLFPGVGGTFSSSLGSWTLELNASANVGIVTLAFVCLQGGGRLLFLVFVSLLKRGKKDVPAGGLTAVCTSVMFAAGLAMCAFATTLSALFWTGLVVFSVAYGLMWSLQSAMLYEGPVVENTTFSDLAAMVLTPGAVASLVLNLATGLWYKAVCAASNCFRDPFLFLAALSVLLVALASTFLYRKLRVKAVIPRQAETDVLIPRQSIQEL
jgi:hypothetical protein